MRILKYRILPVLLALLLMAVSAPAALAAGSETLYMNGVLVVGGSTGIDFDTGTPSGTGWSWNGPTRTLTLDTSYNSGRISIPNPGNTITINVIGNVTVETNDSRTLQSFAPLSITGSGKLALINNFADRGYAIYTNHDWTIDMTDGGSVIAISASGTAGIVTVNGGMLVVGKSADALPGITSISPAVVDPVGGETVTIKGTNLTDATSVKVDGTEATDVNVVDANTITFKTSAHDTDNVNVKVTTPGGTVECGGILKFAPLPQIDSHTIANFLVGQEGEFTITATNNPTSFTCNRPMPRGLTLDKTTGVISGTPEDGTQGPYTIPTYATNVYGDSEIQMLTLRVLKRTDITDLSFTDPATLNHIYSGSAQGIGEVKGVSGLGAITVKYKIGDTPPSTTVPTDAGKYVVSADVAESSYYTESNGWYLGDYTIAQATVTSIDTTINDVFMTAYEASSATNMEAVLALANLPGTVNVTTTGGTAALPITWAITGTYDVKGASYTATGTLTGNANIANGGRTKIVPIEVTTVTAPTPTFADTLVITGSYDGSATAAALETAGVLPTGGSVTVQGQSIPYTVSWTGGPLDTTTATNTETFTGTVSFTEPPEWLTMPANLSVTRKVTVTAKEQVTITLSDVTNKAYTGAAYLYGTVTSGDVTDLDWQWVSTDVGGYDAETPPTNVGDYKVTVSVPGENTQYFGSAEYTFSITKASQTITFPAPTITRVGQSETLSASSSSGLAVTYSSSDSSIAKIEGALLTLLNPGDVTITAKQAGDSNRQAATDVTSSFTVLPVASTNAALSGLTISSGTLSPYFSADTISYTATVPNSVSSVTIGATAKDSKASISGDTGAKSLSVGQNTFNIVVTAEDETTTKTYTVVITRETAPPAASTDATLSGLTISSGTLSPAFSADTTSYTATVPNSVSSVTIGATAKDSKASISGDTGAKSLSVGQNTFKIVVTAEDGTTTKTYTVVITRESGGGGNNTGGNTTGGGTTTTTPSDKITAPTTEAGWTDAAKKVNDLKDGSEFTVDMKNSTTVSGDFLEAVAGKDVEVSFDMGGGMSWTVNGKDIPKGVDLAALNLGVSTGTTFVPAEVRNIDGSIGEVQLRLSHNGELPFPMTLSVKLDKVNAGNYANLYYYNPETDALEFQSAVKIGADGTTEFDFDHASDYLIVVAETSLAPEPETPWQNPFTDVKASDWFYGDV
ncbi:cadherin-like beta sandwich domain-containing protein, partial [Oscillospiraceae bacterium OttesenSCG-928-G22]|nr:cadherin-like beta sandwich domain-containing protein [Oscillospiraceae bacterium OttesenSCG-928-G22]